MTTNQTQAHLCCSSTEVATLPRFYALNGSDFTGPIEGKGKSSCFKVFMKEGEDVICAFTGLGVGVYPSPGV